MVRKRSRIDKSALALSAPRRLRDAGHRRFVASLPCCHCLAQPPTQAAHIRSGQTGGMGLKPSDDLAIPLCVDCHRHQHTTSEVAFHGNIERVKALATALYACSGDWVRGAALVSAYRRVP